MPFLKFSRDKRGYEHFYLVESASRGKPPRTRLLYWFRTPPNIKVGRSPFDPDVRRVLERQNPDVVFDWDAIVSTPIPPPSETERWRERRRLERAMRSAAAEDVEDVDAGAAPPQEPAAPPAPPEPRADVPAAEALMAPEPHSDEGIAGGPGEAQGLDEDVEDVKDVEDAANEPVAASNPLAPGGAPAGSPRRRRRRRRRGRKPQAQGEV